MIGIDLWDKRVWIALLIEWVAIPHDIIARVALIRYLKKLVFDRKSEKMIVGLPYDLYGIDTKQLDKTKKFIKKLKDIFPDVEIIWQDERYTSFEAESVLQKNWKKTKNTYKDDISAALILESYIQSSKAH
jgi:putative holliday junction resolvase